MAFTQRGKTRLRLVGTVWCCWLGLALASGQEQRAAAPSRVDLHGDPLPPGASARLGTLRFRHGGEVNSVALLPDGKTVLSGSTCGVRQWDLATGKELRLFPGYRMALSPDGKTLATVDVNENQTLSKILLIDLGTGKTLGQFDRRLATYTLAFSPDGTMLAATNQRSRNQNQVALWEVATGNELPAPQFSRRFDSATRLAFAPDGKTLATGGDRFDAVRFWDVSTGMEVPPYGLKGQTLAFSPCGKYLALEDWDRADEKADQAVLRVLDAASGKELHALSGLRGGIGAVVFSPAGKTVVAGGLDGQIRCWEAASGKELRGLNGHRDAVTALAFSTDGKVLVSGSKDKTLGVWDVAAGRALHAVSGHQGRISAVALSADGKTALTASWDQTVRHWNLATNQEIRQLSHAAPVRALALAPEGKLLATKSWTNGRSDAQLRVWDLSNGKELRRFAEQPEGSLGLTFSPDSRTLASGYHLGVQRWDPLTGNNRGGAIPFVEQVFRHAPFIAYAPDGKTFAFSSYLHGHLIEAATGKLLRSFTLQRTANHSDPIYWGAFTPDGSTLVLHAEQSLRVWDVARGEELRQFRADPLTGIAQAALSPDGKMVATANLLGTIRLWELATGKERLELRGLQRRVHPAVPKWFPAHLGSATAVAWSADGKRLITGGEDSTVLVWNVLEPVEASARTTSGVAAERCWHELASDDASKAYQAMCGLLANPQQSLPVLRERLRPVMALEPRAVERLVADLDSPQFTVRQQAAEALGLLGHETVAALEKALAGEPSLEVRQVAERLLDQAAHGVLSSTALRIWRAIEVLEHLRSAAACKLLETLAQGAKESRLTQEARAALERSQRALAAR